jgi:hypothetical protein
LFAPLTSHPDHKIKEVAKPPEQVRQVNGGANRKKRKGGRARNGQLEKERPDNDQLETGPAYIEPNRVVEKTILREKTKEERRADYIREKTVAAAPPPCSPKTVYVLANLVRRPSVERLTRY